MKPKENSPEIFGQTRIKAWDQGFEAGLERALNLMKVFDKGHGGGNWRRLITEVKQSIREQLKDKKSYERENT